MQSDQGLHCPLTESLDTTLFMEILCACAGRSQKHILRIREDTFSLDAAHKKKKKKKKNGFNIYVEYFFTYLTPIYVNKFAFISFNLTSSVKASMVQPNEKEININKIMRTEIKILEKCVEIN